MSLNEIEIPILQGAPGINWRPGGWVNNVEYAQNDGVAHNGSSYIALQPNINVEPGTAPLQWDVLALGGSGGGSAGRGIAAIADDYQVSTSGTVAPTGSWATSIPSVPKGEFLWTRTTITLTDETTSTYYSVAYQGQDGGGSGGGAFAAFYVVPHGYSGTVPSGYTQVTQDANNLAVVDMAAGSNVVAIATGGMGTVQLVKNASAFTVQLIDADGLLSSVNVQRV